MGVWALVIGTLAGAYTAAAIAVRASPYRLRIRPSARRALREYASFSWPLFVGSATAVAAGQAPLLVASRELGLAAVGAITLATVIAVFAYRVDEVITQSLYPAIARVKGQLGPMWEAFSMSNRLALLWAVPFGAGAVLFAEPLVDYVLGDRWRPAVVLVQLFGAAAAVNQMGFNWTAFLKAQGTTRPIALTNSVFLLVVLAVAVPLLLSEGLDGYGIGWAVAVTVAVAVRMVFVARLFPFRRIARDVARSLAPTIPAVALVLLLRAGGVTEGATGALVEALVYLLAAGAATLLSERRLLGDAVALLRGRPVGVLTVAAR
jgi:O-antigen/teichoic acid export membrane protein